MLLSLVRFCHKTKRTKRGTKNPCEKFGSLSHCATKRERTEKYNHAVKATISKSSIQCLRCDASMRGCLARSNWAARVTQGGAYANGCEECNAPIAVSRLPRRATALQKGRDASNGDRAILELGMRRSIPMILNNLYGWLELVGPRAKFAITEKWEKSFSFVLPRVRLN